MSQGCWNQDNCCNTMTSCCRVGPMGPRGFAGPKGATGSPGRFYGLQARLRTGTAVATDNPVLFDEVVNEQSESVSYVPRSGNFIITDAGNYFISWQINLNEQPVVEQKFSLVLNGEEIAGSVAVLDRGALNGSALITVTENPSTLQLVNKKATPSSYDDGATVKANIVIVAFR